MTVKSELLAKLAELQALVEQLPDEVPTPEPEPLPPPPADIVLTGEQGYQQFSQTGLEAGTTIDLTGATFIFNNSKNPNPTSTMPCSKGTDPVQPVPILMVKCPGFSMKGGRINGLVPLESDWTHTYCDGSGMRILESPDFTVEDFRGDRLWDGIRFRIGSDNFTIRRVHLSRCRDDLLENDYQHGGLVEDCLLDGGLSIMALDPPSSAPSGTNGRDKVITFRSVLARLQKWNQGGEWTHGSPFKCNTDYPLAEDSNPQLILENCVIAIEDVYHNGKSRLTRAWAKTKATNCHFLNLSDTPLPKAYPTIPAGFTILQGAEARAKWAEAKADWLARHPELGD